MPMPAKKGKKKSTKKLTLKPVKAQLEQILAALEKQLKQKGLTPAQIAIIEKDIQNVQSIIDGLPGGCHKTPAYDLGI
jgi:hypothetical protein